MKQESFLILRLEFQNDWRCYCKRQILHTPISYFTYILICYRAKAFM